MTDTLRSALPWAFLAAFWTAVHLLVRAWWVGGFS